MNEVASGPGDPTGVVLWSKFQTHCQNLNLNICLLWPITKYAVVAKMSLLGASSFSLIEASIGVGKVLPRSQMSTSFLILI